MSFAGLALAAAISLPVALARLSRRRVLSVPAFLYVDAIRGTPLLVQIFGVYYVLPWIGIDLSAVQAAVVALGLNSGAYQAEIVRGGIQALHKGQFEAARSVGMTYLQALRRIILPQVVFNILPAMTNEASGVIKGSSLVSVLAVIELTRVGQQLVASILKPLEIYGGVAAIYLLMHLVLAQFSARIEQRLAVYR